MSGNRTLHREQVGLLTYPPSADPEPIDGESINEAVTTETSSLALWSVACTSSIDCTSNRKTSAPWMIWTTGSGEKGQILRGYSVEETSLQEKQDKLEASALRLQWTHTCVDPNPNAAFLGVSAISTVRNYTGEDRRAGDWTVLCMDLSNVVRIWNLNCVGSSESATASRAQEIPLVASFSVENATGTSAALLPPRVALIGDPKNDLEKVVSVAVGMLDGTVAIVSTGIPIYNPHQKNNPSNNNSPQTVPPAGTILETWGSPSASGKNIPLSLEWNPTKPLTLAVGTGNGVVHFYSKIFTGEATTAVKHHRLSQLGSSPVRAVTFTTDGYLLIAGNDHGRLCLWDCSSSSTTNATQPALVHHLPQAHASNRCWILQAIPIDTRRFCTLASNQTLSLWNVGQMHQAVHTFQSNQALFSLSCLGDDSEKQISTTNTSKAPRVVAGSQNGWIEIFSLEAN